MPVYYELSWAILSTIGLTNVGFGLMVVGIAGFSPIALVPIIVSAAGAIANGLCYYSFYAVNPVTNTAVASGIADLTWLVRPDTFSLALLPAVVCLVCLLTRLATDRYKKPASLSTAMSSFDASSATALASSS